MKIYRLLTAVFLLCQMCFSYGQSNNYLRYYSLYNDALDSIDAGRYIQAGKKFEEAFSIAGYVWGRHWLKAAENALRLQQEGKSVEFLKKAAFNGILPHDTFLMKFTFSDTASIRQVILAAKKEGEKKLNTEYIQWIDTLFYLDQDYRKNMSAPKYINLYVDSITAYSLLRAIKKYGFPSGRQVGPTAYFQAYIILLHADFDLDNQLLGNILRKALEEGDLMPRDYAEIMDRRCNFGRRPYEYYQVPFGYEDLSQGKKSEVNRRRASIGLRSVEKSMRYVFLPNGDLRVQFIDN